MSELIQGSPEWKQARCGSLGASQVADAVAKIKTGYGASRANLLAQLLCERLTGTPTETFTNAAMQWGKDYEAEARAAYEAHSAAFVEEVGLVKHPHLAFTHASPDGLIASDGLLEIKCPQTAQHIDTLLSEAIDGKYIKQMQWQLCCTGRKWCDFVSYDPRMPEHMRLFVKRVQRDDPAIAELEREVRLFLEELAQKYIALTTKYDLVKAA